jgi:pimeloyl-ACP methyl ester carboxylesterase
MNRTLKKTDINHLKILNHPIISQRYFFPRAVMISQPFWVECEEARLACSYHEIDRDAYTIVHFHGNGEVVADYLDGFPELLGRMGCNCFLAEFRGYGGSTGIPQLGRMLEDVKHTIDAIKQPQEKLLLFGRSVGSLFAIKAAELFPEIAGLILESAIADPLERLLLRVSPEELGTTSSALATSIKDALDIQRCMTNFTKPTLILHTRHDGLIDVSHAERLAKWCSGPVKIEIFDQGNHNDIMFINGPRYFALINEFLEQLRS